MRVVIPAMSDDRHLADVLNALSTALADRERAEDIAHLALLAARAEFPRLSVESCEAELERLAAAAETQYARAGGPRAALRAMNRVLFDIERYRGNAEDYYDPNNSYLNQVLRRRVGIPITLCAVFMAVAQRLGVALRPLALPLHFMVAYGSGADEMILDPYHGGLVRTRKECEQFLRGLAGVPIVLNDDAFSGVSCRQMLYRMLNNLKMVYYRRNDFMRAGRTVELMLLVGESPPEEIRDRGLIYIKEGKPRRAADYLTRYLSAQPDASDASIVREQIEAIYATQALRN